MSDGGRPEGATTEPRRAAVLQTRRPDRVFAGYAFDLDGTVYLGDELIPGADRAIAWLRDTGSRVVFVTNKPLDTASGYAAKLTRMGIPAKPSDVVTALDALVRYLLRNHRGARLLLVSEALVARTLIDAGFSIVEAPADADVVVVSFDRTFDYGKLLAAYRAVNAGAVIVATNPDPCARPPTVACRTARRSSRRSRRVRAPAPRRSSASRACTWPTRCAIGCSFFRRTPPWSGTGSPPT
jgi:hypothetical protein